jgi:hypothetical protein
MRTSLRVLPRVELLENRLVPSVTVAETSAGLLTVRGDNADGNSVQASDLGNGTVSVTFGNANTGFRTATFGGVTGVKAVLGNGAGNSYTYQYLGDNLTTNQEVFKGIGNNDNITIGAVRASQTTTGINLTVHTKSPTQPSLPSPTPFFSGDTVRINLANVADNATVNVSLDGKGDRGQNHFNVNVNAQTIGSGASVNITEQAGKAADVLFAQIAGAADNTSGTFVNGGNFNVTLNGGGGAVTEDVVVNIAGANGLGFGFSTVTENGGGGAATVEYEQNDPTNEVFAGLDGGGNPQSAAFIDFDAGQAVGARGFGLVAVS